MATDKQRKLLRRRVQLLAWLTIGYNTLEGVVAIAAGLAASSVALVSFGLDSAVEVLSAIAIAWQFAGEGQHHDAREARTRRLVAGAFGALAIYVAYEAVKGLITHSAPESSAVGVWLAIASLIVMPLLVLAKRRAGRALGSATVVADSMQTMLCTYLSAVLLVGLVLNATLGWWWADPLAALMIAAVAAREGYETWQGEEDCC